MNGKTVTDWRVSGVSVGDYIDASNLPEFGETTSGVAPGRKSRLRKMRVIAVDKDTITVEPA